MVKKLGPLVRSTPRSGVRNAAAFLTSGTRGALPFLILIAVIHVALAWPGAATRGIIAEEIQPYLLHYPKVLAQWDGSVRLQPPNDDPRLLAAVEEGREV